MKNKFIGAICAVCFVMGASSSANADIVNINFSNASSINSSLTPSTMNYSFGVQVTEFTELGQTFYTSNAVFLGATSTSSFGVVDYQSSNFDFQFINTPSTGLKTVFEITDITSGSVVSSLVFEGVAGFANDTTDTGDLHFMMDYVNPDIGGQATLFRGLNYQIGAEPLTNVHLVGVGNNSSSSAIFEYSEVYVSTVSAVPVPAAVWLFGSGLIGLAGVARRKV